MSVDHALQLLAELGPEARVVAGGHSLLPMMKLRLAAPEHLVDINDLTDLDYIREEGDEVRIGALARHRDLLASELLAERFPIVAECERRVADPVVRNRGTIGGSLCQADPAEDLCTVCTVLKATGVVRGREGERTVDMRSFETGPFETVVGDAELLTEVRFPVRPGHGSAYEKVKRRMGDWAIAAVGVALWVDGGTISDAGVGLTNLGPTTLHVDRAEEALIGQAPSEELFDRVAAIAAEDARPSDDQRGPEDYKRHLAGELTRRALRRAAGRALGQEVER
jgi:carbon-monoxide dehydrogenase medium subunit